MGKFINFLVPDYIYKADDDESKVIKLLIVSVSLYGAMLVFFKVINVKGKVDFPQIGFEKGTTERGFSKVSKSV